MASKGKSKGLYWDYYRTFSFSIANKGMGNSPPRASEPTCVLPDPLAGSAGPLAHYCFCIEKEKTPPQFRLTFSFGYHC